jgi:hypothetical protein
LYKNNVDISSHTATGTYKTIEELIGMDHKAFSQNSLLYGPESRFQDSDCPLSDAALSMWRALSLGTNGTYLPSAEIKSAASNALCLVLTHYNSIFPSSFYSCHAALTSSWKSALEDRWKLLSRIDELSNQLERAASIHNHAIADLDSSLIIRELQSEIMDAMLKRETLVQKTDWLRRSLESAIALLSVSNSKNKLLQMRISQLLSFDM